jgi:iron complex outermembrane receptor protein
VIGGIRYTYEEKEIDIERQTFDFVNLDPTITGFPRTHDEADWEALTPKIGLQFEAWKEGFLYGTIARGVKSGGFNAFTEQVAPPFDPEYVTAYEAGLKSQWFDRRLQFNASGFYNHHTDLQVLTTAPGNANLEIVTTNAEAQEMGVECEVLARPFKRLEITANTAVLDAEYLDFTNANGINVAGNTLKRAPEFSAYLGVAYTIPLRHAGTFSLLGEHLYQSRFYFTETNESILSQSGYHLFNARLGYETKNQRCSVAFYGKNLTDEEIIDVALDVRDYTGTVNYAYQPPRTYGVELSYKY